MEVVPLTQADLRLIGPVGVEGLTPRPAELVAFVYLNGASTLGELGAALFGFDNPASTKKLIQRARRGLGDGAEISCVNGSYVVTGVCCDVDLVKSAAASPTPRRGLRFIQGQPLGGRAVDWSWRGAFYSQILESCLSLVHAVIGEADRTGDQELKRQALRAGVVLAPSVFGPELVADSAELAGACQAEVDWRLQLARGY